MSSIRYVSAVPVEDHRTALARIQELELRVVCNRVCPECGPVEMDEDGCCPMCGATVDGAFVRRLLGHQEVPK